MNNQSSKSGMVTLLSTMMFLQFFAWGSWFATLSAALDTHSLGRFIGASYDRAPIAAILAPLFLGLIADRLFASEKVMGILMLIGGGLMMAIPGVAELAIQTEKELLAAVAESGAEPGPNKYGELMVWLILGHLLCYMPTLGLGNTIAFTHIPSQEDFPKIRVWGTIGWIAAGLFLGAMGWSSKFYIFWLGGISSVLLGLFCFALPNTPPPLRGKPMDLRSIFMVDALKLLGDFNFLIFAICSTLICVPLAYYYGMTSTFLNQTGFAEPGATMTLGQMSEIIFMILIPFFFRKLGVKMMILVGMAAWVIRYLLFAFGAPDQVTWMLLAAVILHGVCYDFFFVTGFMYTDKKAPKDIRGQAQGLLVFLTQGVGMFFGYRIMAAGEVFGRSFAWKIGEYGEQVTSSADYNEALKAARGETESLAFFETFGKMFSRSLPDGLDQELLATTMQQWKNFWMFPAIMAGIVMIFFAVAFWDRTKADDSTE